MKGNYLIAVCDILGFSNLILKNDLDTVLKFGLGFPRKTLQHSFHKQLLPDEEISYKILRTHNELGITWFSDTIIIYTKKDEDKTCRKLLETVGWLLFENMFSANSRMRIGISYGEAYINEVEEIYIGKPIVEAYNLEKIQEWSGGAMTKKAGERFGNYLASLNPMESWVIPYEVPIKNKLKERLLSINWTNGIHHSDFEKF